MRPGAPFWNGFTAFFANVTALITLDQLDTLTFSHLWVVLLFSFFVAGAVYGRAKIDEQQKKRNGVVKHK